MPPRPRACQLPIRTTATARISQPPISFGLLGTYPPTQCGLATFAAALRDGVLGRRPGTRFGIVRMVDEDSAPPGGQAAGGEVVYELRTQGRTDPGAAAAHLNRFDVAVIQHEYGIFGGWDGAQVLDVLRHVDVPVIVVLHTVLSTPTPHQKDVMESLVAAADMVVTLSATARLRLRAGYRVDERKILTIPHGARVGGRPDRAVYRASRPGSAPLRPIVLTWGLLGPGKGLEWGVEALVGLRLLDPAPVYVVAGQTHPRVLARAGERYRDWLRARSVELGVAEMLRFEPGYLDADTLHRLVASADVILLPYDSHEQVTSGVLIEAVASLTPVVATAFPHAREMLADGAGTLVAHGDPAAISAALYRVLTEPAHAAAMVAGAARIASTLAWPVVAECYLRAAEALLGQRVAAGARDALCHASIG